MQCSKPVIPSTMSDTLPHGISEDLLLECAILWNDMHRLEAVKKWKLATHLPIDLAKQSLEHYLAAYELTETTPTP